jgi:hypothetical protein
MTVSGFINGKPVTERYHAANPDALRRLSPDAYDEWRNLESNSTAPGGGVVIQQMPNGQQIIIRGGGRVIFNGGQLIDPSDDRDLLDLTENLQQQIADKKLSDAQRAQIMQGLQQVKAADDAQRQRIDPDQRKLQDVYLKACDDLRKQLADVGLPDPGPLLPPPEGVRLGVVMDGESDPLTGGLMISVVTPGSRGQKIGLTAQDVVHAINGQAISTVRDLRAALMKNPRLEVDITRDGQEMTLKEKAPAADATK